MRTRDQASFILEGIRPEAKTRPNASWCLQSTVDERGPLLPEERYCPCHRMRDCMQMKDSKGLARPEVTLPAEDVRTQAASNSNHLGPLQILLHAFRWDHRRPCFSAGRLSSR